MKEPIDLGDDHSMTLVHYEGEVSGANVMHKQPDGTDCAGWIAFAGRAWARSFEGGIATWTVESENPLTLSPSILCRVCGDHGFIREGKWVRA